MTYGLICDPIYEKGVPARKMDLRAAPFFRSIFNFLFENRLERGKFRFGQKTLFCRSSHIRVRDDIYENQKFAEIRTLRLIFQRYNLKTDWLGVRVPNASLSAFPLTNPLPHPYRPCPQPPQPFPTLPDPPRPSGLPRRPLIRV